MANITKAVSKARHQERMDKLLKEESIRLSAVLHLARNATRDRLAFKHGAKAWF